MRSPVRAAIGAFLAAGLALSGGVVVLTANPAPAQAASRKDVEDKQKQNAAERKKIEAQLEDTDAHLKETFLKLTDAQGNLKVAQLELQVAQSDFAKAQRESDQLKQRLTAAEQERSEVEAEIKENEESLNQAQEALAQIARDSATDAGMADSRIGLLLSADTFSQLVSNYEAADVAAQSQQNAIFELQQQQGAMANQQARLKAVEQQIAELKEKADAKAAEAKAAQERAAAKQRQIQGLIAEQTKLAADLKEAKKGYEAKEAQLEAESKKLQSQLQEIARKEAEAYKQGKAVLKTDGVFSYPVANPVITSPFGMRFHPILHVWKLHTGTDFGVGCGTPIMAAAPGKVLWAQYEGAWGNQVAIDHGIMKGAPTVSLYDHQSRMIVHAGQTVQRGQVVGYVGSTGYSTGCHLHFEVHRNGSPVNPMQYF